MEAVIREILEQEAALEQAADDEVPGGFRGEVLFPVQQHKAGRFWPHQPDTALKQG